MNNTFWFFTDRHGEEYFISANHVQAVSSDPFTADDGNPYHYVKIYFADRVNTYTLTAEQYKRLKETISK